MVQSRLLCPPKHAHGHSQRHTNLHPCRHAVRCTLGPSPSSHILSQMPQMMLRLEKNNPARLRMTISPGGINGTSPLVSLPLLIRTRAQTMHPWYFEALGPKLGTARASINNFVFTHLTFILSLALAISLIAHTDANLSSYQNIENVDLLDLDRKSCRSGKRNRVNPANVGQTSLPKPVNPSPTGDISLAAQGVF